MTKGERTGVPVGTLAGTVGRAGAGAAIGVVAPGPPRVTHPPGVTGRRYVGHWWISRSLYTRSRTSYSTRQPTGTRTVWTTTTRPSRAGCVSGLHKTGRKYGFPWTGFAFMGPSRPNSSPSCAGSSGPSTKVTSGRARRSTWWAPSLPGHPPLGSTRSSLTRPGTSRAGLLHPSLKRCTGSLSITRTPSP